MNLTISGHHLDLTPAIQSYVSTKLERVLKHCQNVAEAQIILGKEPLAHKAEITLRLHGKDIHCTAYDDNLYAAIDILSDMTDRQIIKRKGKMRGGDMWRMKHAEAGLAPDPVQ